MADMSPPAEGEAAPATADPIGTDRLEDVTATPLWRIRLRLFRTRFAGQWRIFAKNRFGLFGLGLILVFGFMAIAHPILMMTVWDNRTYNPVSGRDDIRVEREVVPRDQLDNPHTQVRLETAQIAFGLEVQVGDTLVMPAHPAPPSAEHWLGTDPNGRDVMSQLLYGARAAFLLGAMAALTTVVLATLVGAFAAYFGGIIDSVLMRLADLFLLLPLIPVLAVLTLWFSPNMITLGVMIGLVSGFGSTAILLKSHALAVRVKPFIDAARVAGGGHAHVVFKHIVPNVIPMSFLFMMFTVTGAIGTEATLSFFGLLDVPMSWGIMVHIANTGGYLLLGFDYWWLLFPSGLAVTLLAAAFYFAGRAMDAVINPRLRQR